MKTKIIKIKVKTNEKKIFPVFWLGEKDEKIIIKAILDKPESSLYIVGILFAEYNSLKLETEIIHQAFHTFSRTLVRGVLDGSAQVNYEGKILIEKGAKNTDADLSSHIILLSPLAKAEAIPSLRVLENEVTAGHAATVGKIDENQLFYLQSRGFNIFEAKKLIIQGFFASLLEQFPEKEKALVNKKLKII